MTITVVLVVGLGWGICRLTDEQESVSFWNMHQDTTVDRYPLGIRRWDNYRYFFQGSEVSLALERVALGTVLCSICCVTITARSLEISPADASLKT
ncbi:hypothetical protein B0J14DRAFT_104641 [Halenospora varia]|nr:hypothetical protein B0J14DRAFT_104641 [Halenospora varia]